MNHSHDPRGRINLDELLTRLAAARDTVVPFVGSGLAMAAGAPSDARLAEALGRRLGVSVPDRVPSLLQIMSELPAERIAEAKEAVAEIIRGLMLRPTPVLTALASVPSRRVLTTNYDDAIERAGLARGLRPITLTADDARVLQEPPADHFHVIHVHGIAAEPESIVLPGKSTDDAAGAEPQQSLLRGRLAASPLLYVGFSFADSELALRAAIAWIGRHFDERQAQWLLVPERELSTRPDFFAQLRSSEVMTTVGFDTIDGYHDVERVALTLAPRASTDKAALTWVIPRLIDVTSADQQELTRTLLDWDFQSNDGQTIALDRLTEPGATLVIAGPGMGKSTLLGKLADAPDAALGRLGDFRVDTEHPEHAVADLLRTRDGEALGLDGLDEHFKRLCLDGLDEIRDPRLREQAAGAISDAIDRWPEHAWVISTRPSATADPLVDMQLRRAAIVPSRAWAETYLRTRGISADRRTRASLEEHGLGDMLVIPLFAERIADRLLDDEPLPDGPLALLIDEQRLAARREAAKRGVRERELFDWLCRVAVALELRALSSATIDEIASVTGHGALEAGERRAMLADATLLRDVPGHVSFALRTMQQALCAATLLGTDDLCGVLERVAVANVDGRRTLRDDTDFTLDLIFHAARSEDRAALRELDEQRWARTVPAGASEQEAEAALDAILAWHSARDIELGRWRPGLRSPAEAARELLRRFPQIAERRHDGLVADLQDVRVSARLRAMTLLAAALPVQNHTTRWLAPLFDDDSDTIVAHASALIETLGITEHATALRRELTHRTEIRRNTALRALLSTSREEEFPAILHDATPGPLPRIVVEQLRERVHDLDLAFQVLAAISQPDHQWAWLLGRFIDDARKDAWTPQRVRTLVDALDGRPSDGVDIKQVGAVLATHPDAALEAVRVTYLSGTPYVDSLVLRCVEQGCGPQLADAKYQQIRQALARMRIDEQDRHRYDPEHAVRILAAALDEHGTDIDPDYLLPPVRLKSLSPSHQALLHAFVERWWPQTITVDVDMRDRRTAAALSVGEAVDFPLSRERWLQLLDALLTTPKSQRFDLVGDRAGWWLGPQYSVDFDDELLMRMPNQGADGVAMLIGLSGRKASRNLLDAAARRLAQIPSDSGWSGAAGLLAERDARDPRMRLLADLRLEPTQRRYLDASLARHGNSDAQMRLIAGWTANPVELTDEEHTRLSWHPDASHRGMLTALTDLAAACIAAGKTAMLEWTASAIGQMDNVDALRVLLALADEHPARARLLCSRADSLRGRLATRDVLARIPTPLGELTDRALGTGAS